MNTKRNEIDRLENKIEELCIDRRNATLYGPASTYQIEVDRISAEIKRLEKRQDELMTQPKGLLEMLVYLIAS